MLYCEENKRKIMYSDGSRNSNSDNLRNSSGSWSSSNKKRLTP